MLYCLVFVLASLFKCKFLVWLDSVDKIQTDITHCVISVIAELLMSDLIPMSSLITSQITASTLELWPYYSQNCTTLALLFCYMKNFYPIVFVRSFFAGSGSAYSGSLR